jgi:hypothetical protein
MLFSYYKYVFDKLNVKKHADGDVKSNAKNLYFKTKTYISSADPTKLWPMTIVSTTVRGINIV